MQVGHMFILSIKIKRGMIYIISQLLTGGGAVFSMLRTFSSEKINK